MRSNCQLYAWREYWRRYVMWEAAGCPKGQGPWLHMRPSKLRPRWAVHAQVGGGGLPTMEFVPVDHVDLPWWRAWQVLLFRGRVRPADFPTTVPTDHQPLTD
jgi:hypothetical protein